MADQQYLTALQPYLALAKSATGRAAADLVMQATSAPGTYVFSELLSMPNIQALSQNPDGVKYLELLKIFAYGSYMDYKASSSSLPPLSPPQLQKLKQLTLITLSSLGPQHLTYSSLLTTLDLPSTRVLEDLVISAIYVSLLSAKLDTKHSLIEVSSTAGRDVAPSEIPAMIATLQNWCAVCEDVLDDIDAQVKSIHRDAVARKKGNDEYERVLNTKREMLRGDEKGGMGKGKRVISEGADDGGLGRGWREEDEMDLDDGPFGEVGGANTSKRRTKGRFAGFMGGSRSGRR